MKNKTLKNKETIEQSLVYQAEHLSLFIITVYADQQQIIYEEMQFISAFDTSKITELCIG